MPSYDVPSRASDAGPTTTQEPLSDWELALELETCLSVAMRSDEPYLKLQMLRDAGQHLAELSARADVAAHEKAETERLWRERGK